MRELPPLALQARAALATAATPTLALAAVLQGPVQVNPAQILTQT